MPLAQKAQVGILLYYLSLLPPLSLLIYRRVSSPPSPRMLVSSPPPLASLSLSPSRRSPSPNPTPPIRFHAVPRKPGRRCRDARRAADGGLGRGPREPERWRGRRRAASAAGATTALSPSLRASSRIPPRRLVGGADLARGWISPRAPAVAAKRRGGGRARRARRRAREPQAVSARRWLVANGCRGVRWPDPVVAVASLFSFSLRPSAMRRRWRSRRWWEWRRRCRVRRDETEERARVR